MEQVLARFDSPELRSAAADPADTAAVVFEAATDGRDRIRYLTDAIARDQVAMMDGFAEERLQSYGNPAPGPRAGSA